MPVREALRDSVGVSSSGSRFCSRLGLPGDLDGSGDVDSIAMTEVFFSRNAENPRQYVVNKASYFTDLE